ncbi:MAG: DUF6473 family protein [Maritimibacter sp.]|jgi:hypothetical protein
MAYENLGEGALDYYPCRYGKSKLLFRGPKRKLDEPYAAMIGGTETYGKFVETPFPALTEELLDEPVVNMGMVNAGIDVFINDQSVIDICSAAEVTVVQATGAQNMSNRFYAVHPRRNDRFLRASNLLKTIYREVDFTDFNFTRHLLTALKEASPDKFLMVEQELKEAWVARMKTLVSNIESDVVLLWLSDHSPDKVDDQNIGGSDPLFVDRDMLREVEPFVAGIAEVVVQPEEIEAGFDGLVYSDLEEPAARGMLGTVAHDKVAEALRPLLAGFF